MYNARNIIIGLAIFLVLLTYPIWNGAGSLAAGPEISLDTPAIMELTVKECVEDTALMRSSHMVLLSRWKEAVVRDNNRIYVAANGSQYSMSLQNTCMECHSNKSLFCDSCHSYSGVKTPSCWDCHVEPREDGR
jgi:hypothetical protein